MEETFEEIQEMFETNTASHMNFCRMGGMTKLLQMIIENKDKTNRARASRVFGSLVSNNSKTQEFARYSGAINLAVQVAREDDAKTKEPVLGALTAYLRGNNFVGKRDYIQKVDGLNQLAKNLCEFDERKIRIKLIQLCNDLVMNDDSIFDFGFKVRDYFIENDALLKTLFSIIVDTKFEVAHTAQQREFTLAILQRIN